MHVTSGEDKQQDDRNTHFLFQYFVTCSLGAEYVGFCMITLGIANVGGAVVVALVSHKVPREVVLGFGGIMHMALMIGFLIWIPDRQPMLFFILAAAWGVCDAVWQTQCNSELWLLSSVLQTWYFVLLDYSTAKVFTCLK